MSGGELILVFTKPAVPGSVKTRLVPPLTPRQAADFHLALLSDVVALARAAVDDRVELCVAEEDSVGAFRNLYPNLNVWAQQGGGLGERLVHAFGEAFARGFEKALIIGSDHPTLPVNHLREALYRLRSVDLVFGPSRDGGYYAVGSSRQCWPEAGAVFRSIPWSTKRVLRASLQRARQASLRIALAPEWYDIDCPSDLELLLRDADPEAASARFLRDLERRRT